MISIVKPVVIMWLSSLGSSDGFKQKSNSFKCAVNEIDKPEDDNENTDSVNCEFFWNIYILQK